MQTFNLIHRLYKFNKYRENHNEICLVISWIFIQTWLLLLMLTWLNSIIAWLICLMFWTGYLYLDLFSGIFTGIYWIGFYWLASSMTLNFSGMVSHIIIALCYFLTWIVIEYPVFSNIYNIYEDIVSVILFGPLFCILNILTGMGFRKDIITKLNDYDIVNTEIITNMFIDPF